MFMEFELQSFASQITNETGVWLASTLRRMIDNSRECNDIIKMQAEKVEELETWKQNHLREAGSSSPIGLPASGSEIKASGQTPPALPDPDGYQSTMQ